MVGFPQQPWVSVFRFSKNDHFLVWAIFVGETNITIYGETTPHCCWQLTTHTTPLTWPPSKFPATLSVSFPPLASAPNAWSPRVHNRVSGIRFRDKQKIAAKKCHIQNHGLQKSTWFFFKKKNMLRRRVVEFVWFFVVVSPIAQLGYDWGGKGSADGESSESKIYLHLISEMTRKSQTQSNKTRISIIHYPMSVMIGQISV